MKNTDEVLRSHEMYVNYGKSVEFPSLDSKMLEGRIIWEDALSADIYGYELKPSYEIKIAIDAPVDAVIVLSCYTVMDNVRNIGIGQIVYDEVQYKKSSSYVFDISTTP